MAGEINESDGIGESDGAPESARLRRGTDEDPTVQDWQLAMTGVSSTVRTGALVEADDAEGPHDFADTSLDEPRIRLIGDDVVEVGHQIASHEIRVEADGPVEVPKSELRPEVYEFMGKDVIREAEILLQTKDLVHGTDGPEEDDYLKDALGQVGKEADAYTSRKVLCSDAARIGTMRRSTLDLTSYAAKTGREDAAQFGFEHLNDGDKWLVYADAYDTSKLRPQILAEWRHQLNVAHEGGAEDQSTVTQASRMMALTMEKLHDYSSIIDPERLAALREQQGLPAEGDGKGLTLEELATARAEHKQMAIEYGTRLNDLLTEMRATKEHPNQVMGRTWSADNLEGHAMLAFARAGVWEGAAVLQGRHLDRHVQRVEQTIKAAHGQLGFNEKQRLRFSGDTGKLLRWLNDPQQDAPSVDYQNVHNLRLLEQLVPDRLKSIGYESFSELSSLRLSLDAEDYESVRANYVAYIARYGQSSSIGAALMVSQHLYEVQAAGAAHEVYEGAFLSELEPVESQVNGLFESGNDNAPNADIVEGLSRLYAECSKLKDPVTSLHAKGRLATMYLKAAPNDPNVLALMTDIRKQWEQLERREGGERDLVHTYKTLKSAGIDFEPQWKQNGTDGFIGFRPSSTLQSRRQPSEYRPFREGRYVDSRVEDRYIVEIAKEIVDTAAALNRVLGFERYQVEIAPEDMEQVEALRAHNATRTSAYDLFPHRETKYPIVLHGPWRTLFSTENDGYNREFSNATDSLRTGWHLHDDTSVTKRLRRLIDQAEEEWQHEQAS